MTPPLVIGIEGVDGAGKTTQSKILVECLQQQGFRIAYHKFRRWGGDVLAAISGPNTQLRKNFPPSYVEFVLACDEYRNCYKIASGSSSNAIIIRDRTILTRIVNVEVFKIQSSPLDKILASIPRPDLTILIDVDYNDIHKRLNCRGHTIDEVEYGEQAIKVYRRIALREPHVIIVNGRGTIKEVQQEIFAALEQNVPQFAMRFRTQ